jgi:hypothetical protein
MIRFAKIAIVLFAGTASAAFAAAPGAVTAACCALGVCCGLPCCG